MTIQGDVIFCDDIRHEITGKALLIGCYGATMNVSGDFPITIDRLMLACRLFLPAAHIPASTKLMVYYPQSSDEPDFEADIPMPPQMSGAELAEVPRAEEKFDPRLQVTFQVELEDMDISSEGFIRVRAQCDDNYIRVGDLRVLKLNEEAAPTEEEPKL